MDLSWEERPSDSALVDTVWRNVSEQSGPFISMAETQLTLVVTKRGRSRFLTVRGPASVAAAAQTPAEAEFLGIVFQPGVFMPDLPAPLIRERHDLSLPEAASGFWLKGSVWQYPGYESADAFVNRLVREGLLAYDAAVGAALEGRAVDTTGRTLRRRFLRATGLTHGAIYQIERARHATRLLKRGMSILDAVAEAGYFDQPHMTRSLKRYIGLTPAQIIDAGRSERLSVLYKKTPAWLGYNKDIAEGEPPPK